MSDPSFYNPLLDDDDDEQSLATPQLQPKPTAAVTVKATPNKSVRRGTPRARATAKDAVLLGFLGKHRVATADTLSMLLKAEAFPGSEASGKTTSVDTTRSRLHKLERLGLVEHDRTWTGELIYGITGMGKGAAVDFGYLNEPHEAAQVGLKGLNYSMLPHTLAVSSVAARFASQLGMAGFGVLAPESLVTEYTLRSAIKPHEVRLKAAMKQAEESNTYMSAKNAANFYWGSYRAERLEKWLDEGVLKGRANWGWLLQTAPELFTLGHPQFTTDTWGHQKHFPDLVISLEDKRTSRTPVSFFTEVELVPKSLGGYSTVLNTYKEERERGVYKGCYYFTNSVAVKNAVTRADKQQELGLIESGWLKFASLKNSKGELLKDGKRIGE